MPRRWVDKELEERLERESLEYQQEQAMSSVTAEFQQIESKEDEMGQRMSLAKPIIPIGLVLGLVAFIWSPNVAGFIIAAWVIYMAINIYGYIVVGHSNWPKVKGWPQDYRRY